jgi:glycoside/pentoside/hexuronide:cation symporter, GPH family
VLLFPWAMLPDVLEFDRLATGQRREGLIYALFTLVQKASYALGVFLSGQALERFGYDRAAAAQSERAITGIELMLGPATAVLLVLGLVALTRYPITARRHDEARAALAAEGS